MGIWKKQGAEQRQWRLQVALKKAISQLEKRKAILEKHVILPGGVSEAITAWVILTYCYDAFRILPILGIISPVKRCGKTTLLEVLQGLTSKGLTASNITPAAVYRTIEKYRPTLLVDEFDTFVRDNDELKGVLNSGHTRANAFVIFPCLVERHTGRDYVKDRNSFGNLADRFFRDSACHRFLVRNREQIASRPLRSKRHRKKSPGITGVPQTVPYPVSNMKG